MLTPHEYYINLENATGRVTIGYDGAEVVWEAYDFFCNEVAGTDVKVCLWDGSTGEVLAYNWEDEEEA